MIVEEKLLQNATYEELAELYSYVGKLKKEKYNTSEAYIRNRIENTIKNALDKMEKEKKQVQFKLYK